jgi:hypothetical protein
MVKREAKIYRHFEGFFGPVLRAKTRRMVKIPYRGICKRLMGLKTLIWFTRAESAKEKIPKM